MKAQTKVLPRAVDPLRALVAAGKEPEMLACFDKLKELVPSVPADGKISRVALLQHVIDYILDLELTLDHHPAARTPPPALLAAALTERKPLTESTNLNTQSHLEAMELGCSSRPASC